MFATRSQFLDGRTCLHAGGVDFGRECGVIALGWVSVQDMEFGLGRTVRVSGHLGKTLVSLNVVPGISGPGRCGCLRAKSKPSHQPGELLGLCRQLFGSSGGLFCIRRGLLDGSVHLGHGLVGLLNALALLLAGCSDLLHDGAHLFNRRHNLIEVVVDLARARLSFACQLH